MKSGTEAARAVARAPTPLAPRRASRPDRGRPGRVSAVSLCGRLASGIPAAARRLPRVRGARRRALRPAGARPSRPVRVDARAAGSPATGRCWRRLQPRFRPGRTGESRSATACAAGAPSPVSSHDSARRRPTCARSGRCSCARDRTSSTRTRCRTLPEATSRAEARAFRSSYTCTSSLRPARSAPSRSATAAKTADVLVVVSEAVARVVRPHAGDTPILVAYNGVADASRHGSASSTSPTVGTIGTVCRTKGTDVFLEAAALARERRPELRFEHIGQTGLDEDVEFERRVVARSQRCRRACSAAGRQRKGSIAGSSSCSPRARTRSRSRASRRWRQVCP